MRTFSILTLGCKVNSYESEALINKLLDFGYELKNFNDICDVYIINKVTHQVYYPRGIFVNDYMYYEMQEKFFRRIIQNQ